MSVDIYGGSFVSVPQVYFGRREAPGVSFRNSGYIEAVKPAAADLGDCDIRVCNPDGQCAVLPNAFTVTVNEPLHDLFLPAVRR